MLYRKFSVSCLLLYRKLSNCQEELQNFFCVFRRNIVTIFERIEELRKAIGISQGKLEKELGFSNGSISKWKNSTPKSDRLQKLADYFGVSVEYLMTGTDDGAKEQPQLSARDERDISRRLEQTLSDLENQQDALMFDGAPLDEETKELLKVSLEHSIRVAKINAKKFTNKRYLNSENQEK